MIYYIHADNVEHEISYYTEERCKAMAEKGKATLYGTNADFVTAFNNGYISDEGFIVEFPDKVEKGSIHFNMEGECIRLRIDPDRFPEVYNARVKDYMDSGSDRAYAEETALEIEVEPVFHDGTGLFLVEIQAIGETDIYSPFTGELAIDSREGSL